MWIITLTRARVAAITRRGVTTCHPSWQPLYFMWFFRPLCRLCVTRRLIALAADHSLAGLSSSSSTIAACHHRLGSRLGSMTHNRTSSHSQAIDLLHRPFDTPPVYQFGARSRSPGQIGGLSFIHAGKTRGRVPAYPARASDGKYSTVLTVARRKNRIQV